MRHINAKAYAQFCCSHVYLRKHPSSVHLFYAVTRQDERLASSGFKRLEQAAALLQRSGSRNIFGPETTQQQQQQSCLSHVYDSPPFFNNGPMLTVGIWTSLPAIIVCFSLEVNGNAMALSSDKLPSRVLVERNITLPKKTPTGAPQACFESTSKAKSCRFSLHPPWEYLKPWEPLQVGSVQFQAVSVRQENACGWKISGAIPRVAIASPSGSQLCCTAVVLESWGADTLCMVRPNGGSK